MPPCCSLLPLLCCLRSKQPRPPIRYYITATLKQLTNSARPLPDRLRWVPLPPQITSTCFQYTWLIRSTLHSPVWNSLWHRQYTECTICRKYNLPTRAVRIGRRIEVPFLAGSCCRWVRAGHDGAVGLIRDVPIIFGWDGGADQPKVLKSQKILDNCFVSNNPMLHLTYLTMISLNDQFLVRSVLVLQYFHTVPILFHLSVINSSRISMHIFGKVLGQL